MLLHTSQTPLEQLKLHSCRIEPYNIAVATNDKGKQIIKTSYDRGVSNAIDVVYPGRLDSCGDGGMAKVELSS